MLTDTDLAELERLCKAREGQRFAGLVLELLAAYRAERARAASEWERAERLTGELGEAQEFVKLGKALADAAQELLNRKGWRIAPDLAEALADYGYAEQRAMAPASARAALAASARRGEG